MGVDNNELFSSELLTELGANNQFFDNLVDMIPAKLYVVGNTGKNGKKKCTCRSIPIHAPQ